LKRIITFDETLVYGHDVEMKIQSSHWVEKKFAKTEKGAAGQVKCERHVDSFF
jgi:hypothetical protein